MHRIRLLLDSNVFHHKKFLAWLRKRSEIDVCVPVVAYVEVYLRSVRRSLFKELKTVLLGIRASVTPLDRTAGERAVDEAVKNPRLPFKHHGRDFLIGATALQQGAVLVTQNKKHFKWMRESVRTPDEIMREQ
ncbi:type II toxin-antitoxin system VapC family toxin [Candidatus Hecatella orcuttiae]|jgi:hypothetical protein|uniref:type II toxin-antitoxin system VapC family toxin n=1 Tax=Candidatus Hecatella orcuttiae TaxID=1935119 RepID=UPI002867D8EC|nr:PIN domain-containing protein [Candidatus Hecatella orcuttiae]